MPTGFTAKVQDGTIFDLRGFAILCARNFGHPIEMRDLPMDAEVPDKFEPSDYHAQRKAQAEADLARFVAMSDDEAEAGARAEFDAEVAQYEAYQKEANDLRIRYTKILDQVKDWMPPTPNHDGLKQFMVNQLKDSIEQDCNTSWRRFPTKKSGYFWLDQAKASAQKEVGYQTEELIKEETRCRTRTEWVRSLKLSLPKASTTPAPMTSGSSTGT